MSKMIEFTTIVAIHLGDGLSFATCEELLLGVKNDSILVELIQHFGGSSHHERNGGIIIT